MSDADKPAKTLITFDKGQFTDRTFMICMQNDSDGVIRITNIHEIQDTVILKFPPNSYYVPTYLAKSFLQNDLGVPNLDQIPTSERIEVPVL